MSQPAASFSSNTSLAYDPMRFQTKSVFTYEISNKISLRLRNLNQRHNDLTDEEKLELSDLKIVESYLQKRVNELKEVT